MVRTHKTYVRLAEHDDGAIYIDLGDTEWQAIRVAKGDWIVVRNPPVKFRRPRGLLPLPVPVRGGSAKGAARIRATPPQDSHTIRTRRCRRGASTHEPETTPPHHSRSPDSAQSSEDNQSLGSRATGR